VTTPVLDVSSNADMMSDMKTFTVRDLDRNPSVVLTACDTEGEVRIRRRDGRTYMVRPEGYGRAMIAALPNFTARRAKLFPRPLSKDFARKFDEALASE
jgi:hypothetical protein